MTDPKKLKAANNVYDTLLKTLDKRDLRYERDDGALRIKLDIQGDDLPIHIDFVVHAEGEFAIVLSRLPLKVAEDDRPQFARAICLVNDRLVNGTFDYNVADGTIFFRMTLNYCDCIIGEEALFYMISCTSVTVDEYNDKFLMLAKNLITMEQFTNDVCK